MHFFKSNFSSNSVYDRQFNFQKDGWPNYLHGRRTFLQGLKPCMSMDTFIVLSHLAFWRLLVKNIGTRERNNIKRRDRSRTEQLWQKSLNANGSTTPQTHINPSQTRCVDFNVADLSWSSDDSLWKGCIYIQASLCAAICEHSDRKLAQDLTLTEQRQRESRVCVLSGGVSHGDGESLKTAYLRGAALPRGKSFLHVTHTAP